MRKMLAVFKREYLAAVRKKMFIFMTLFFPVLMAGMMVVPGLMMAKGLGEKTVSVIDGTRPLRDAFTGFDTGASVGGARRDLRQQLTIEYVDSRGKAVDEVAKPYLARLAADRRSAAKLDAVLLIPADAFDGKNSKMTFYSRAATDIITQERLARMANRAIQRHPLTSRGIAPDALDSMMREVPTEGVQLSRTGEQKKGGELNFVIGFIFAALLLIPSLVYGLEIMRGIIQEKSDRVVEILVSSMSPMQLLTGKVTGIAAVGLTQVSVWILLGVGVASFGAASAMAAGINVLQFLRPI